MLMLGLLHEKFFADKTTLDFEFQTSVEDYQWCRECGYINEVAFDFPKRLLNNIVLEMI